MINCKICNSIAELFGRETILKNYSINFFNCKNCEFIFTEEPY